MKLKLGAIFLLSFLLTGCKKDPQDKFVEQCVDSGNASISACKCMFGRLKLRLPEDQIIEYSKVKVPLSLTFNEMNDFKKHYPIALFNANYYCRTNYN
ncbi:hypothetical protein JZP81_002853 [Salmonella enterica]|uniref:Lipoprotein n=2 Tax=Salmonella enterica TaxID=28901 RepID=A0A8F7UPH7_SALER|nr:hypothetical protein [Salmonella enterica]ECD9379390.1 hypothetical protein [Salmonella enterica subsp. salamae serovar Sofia]ECI2510031.1 hypothetical protein [Salmonella enterica subsp. enterica serovar Paratyphi B]EDT7498434.1 hypothetical protein [Salmonella enterica subsp. enterica serovar Schleissheim]EAZ1915984.1 hypothetical protein [Salmonella enterica]EBA5232596.1 hypothetical protein [Salmonella enterica]